MHLTNDDQQDSHEGQKWDVECAAERHTGDDEGDDEDDEADDHQSSHRLSPSWSPTQTHKLVSTGLTTLHSFCVTLLVL